MIEQLQTVLDSFDFQIERLKPSEFAEKYRVMTSDVSPFPGKFSYTLTPYLREVIDTMAPDNEARIIAVMKGAQLGFSTGVIEPGVGWIMRENPGNILFFVGHSDLVPKAMDKVDQMIDSCGIRHLIRPNSMRRKTQKTGDTNTSKEFPGGSLLLGSPGNHKAIRQLSVRYGFIDDYESMKGFSKESGSTDSMIEQRFAAYQDKMKIYYISTPEVQQTSNIEPAFLRGDQRYYFVPCPLCGEYIRFEWEVKDEAGKVIGGITWKLDKKNKLIEESVGYKCPKCSGIFSDTHKHKMNLAGKWIATAEPEQRGNISYHINSLYAPPGMYDWAHYVNQWLAANPRDAEPIEAKLQTFYNVVLGKTWKLRGKSPKASQLAVNSGRYEIGVVPNALSIKDGNGPIFMLTLGSDLNGVVEDARLDYEIIAWSVNGTTYAVDHGSIGTFIPRENTRKNKTDRERWTYDHGFKNSVWPEFKEVLNSSFKTDDGKEMGIMISGVDTGHYTAQAYDFIDSYEDNLIFGLKGKDIDKMRRFGVDTPIVKKARERDNLYLVEVNQTKDHLAELVSLKWDESLGIDQPPGFMNFPAPNGRKFSMPHYFNHFEAEHRVMERNAKGEDIGARWVKKKSSGQNHLFDCRVYNIAIANLIALLVCKEAGVKEPSWNQFVDLMEG